MKHFLDRHPVVSFLLVFSFAVAVLSGNLLLITDSLADKVKACPSHTMSLPDMVCKPVTGAKPPQDAMPATTTPAIAKTHAG
jgi:hypothetical protein